LAQNMPCSLNCHCSFCRCLKCIVCLVPAHHPTSSDRCPSISHFSSFFLLLLSSLGYKRINSFSPDSTITVQILSERTNTMVSSVACE
jgi:hypothetical protein